MSIKRLVILIAIVVVGLLVLGRAGTVLVDWLWFSSIGYVGVFWTIITTRAGPTSQQKLQRLPSTSSSALRAKARRRPVGSDPSRNSRLRCRPWTFIF